MCAGTMVAVETSKFDVEIIAAGYHPSDESLPVNIVYLPGG